MHVVALPASLAMSWLAKPKENEQVKTWLLSSSLAKFQHFYSECFFNFASINFFLATWFKFSFCLWSPVVFLFCFPWEGSGILKIFWSEIFKKFPRYNPCFRKALHLYYVFFCNIGALKFRMHVVALPASLAMSWLAKPKENEQVKTWLLSSSLAKIQQLQSESFFQICFSLFPPACMGSSSASSIGVPLFFFLFCIRWLDFLFFSLKSSNCFPVIIHVFGKPFSSCTFCL